MRVDLLTHPKVVCMSSALKADRLRVLGGLMAAWCLFDAHSADGKLHGYTPAALDELIGWRGFATAMKAVGWLEVSGGYLVAPRFDEHMSKSAKRRALDSERKRTVRALSAPEADGMPTREEKRRTTRTPPSPRRSASGGLQGFTNFWLAWPKSERKQDRVKCEEHWRRHELGPLADSIVADVRKKRGTKKWAEGYDEAPLTYLRGRRWEDGTEPTAPGAGVGEWWETLGGVEGKAKTIGMPGWDGVELFDDYRGRVKVRVAEAQPA